VQIDRACTGLDMRREWYLSAAYAARRMSLAQEAEGGRKEREREREGEEELAGGLYIFVSVMPVARANR